MKKPVLAALGVAGACVACCAIPLVIPLFGGAAALGLTSWLGLEFGIGWEMLVLWAIVSTAAMLWGGMAWARRRQTKSCGNEASRGSACAVGTDTEGCGCAPR